MKRLKVRGSVRMEATMRPPRAMPAGFAPAASGGGAVCRHAEAAVSSTMMASSCARLVKS
jgi:hypothetical protein